MTGNIDLKELWSRQNASAPDVRETIAKANSYKKKHLYKLLLMNLTLLLTVVFVSWIIYSYKPQMATTRIGGVLTILAMVVFLVVSNRMIPLLLKVDNDTSTAAYLAQLLKIKARQRFLQTTMMNVYYILLSSGIMLYMIEFAMRMSLAGALLSYGLTICWILFSWFYFRTKAIKKQEGSINELVEKFQKIQQQLKD